MKDLISIIVPVYNTEKYLKECLDSIINQSYKNLEIIVVNDGSSDNSISIINEYKKNDKRIKLIDITNHGLSYARNIGVKKSHGDFVLFVDSDDVIHIDMIKILYSNLINTNSDISICEVVRYIDKPNYCITNTVKEFNNIEILKLILEDLKICSYAVNKMLKKDLMKDIEFPIGKKLEDVATTYKYILKANKVCYTDSMLYGYRQTNGSITNNLDLKFIKDYYEAITNRSNDLKNLGIDNYIDLNRVNVILSFFIELSKNRKLYKGEIKRFLSDKYKLMPELYNKTKDINKKSHNILLKILIFNKYIFMFLMHYYLILKNKKNSL